MHASPKPEKHFSEWPAWAHPRLSQGLLWVNSAAIPMSAESPVTPQNSPSKLTSQLGRIAPIRAVRPQSANAHEAEIQLGLRSSGSGPGWRKRANEKEGPRRTAALFIRNLGAGLRNPYRPSHPYRPCHRHRRASAASSPASRRPWLRSSPTGPRPRPRPARRNAPPWSDR